MGLLQLNPDSTLGSPQQKTHMSCRRHLKVKQMQEEITDSKERKEHCSIEQQSLASLTSRSATSQRPATRASPSGVSPCLFMSLMLGCRPLGAAASTAFTTSLLALLQSKIFEESALPHL